jgi:hypothetical protein
MEERKQRLSFEDEPVWLPNCAEWLEFALRPAHVVSIKAQVRLAQCHEACDPRVDSAPMEPSSGGICPCIGAESATVQHIDDGSGNIQRSPDGGRAFLDQTAVRERAPVPSGRHRVICDARICCSKQGEHRRGRDNAWRHVGQQPGRDILAGEDCLEPPPTEELREQLPVAGGPSELRGFEGHPSIGVPHGGSALQIGGQAWIMLTEAGAQQGGEERVIAEPASPIESHEEHSAVFEFR